MSGGSGGCGAGIRGHSSDGDAVGAWPARGSSGLEGSVDAATHGSAAHTVLTEGALRSGGSHLPTT